MRRACVILGALGLAGCGLALDLDPQPPATGEIDAGTAPAPDAGIIEALDAAADAGSAPDAGSDAAVIGPLVDAGPPACDHTVCPWGCAPMACAVPAQLAVGARHACVLTDMGSAFCWGDDNEGQVTGTPGMPVLRPTRVLAADGRFVQLDAGGSHTCALTASGALVCWGRNGEGQLGGTAAAAIVRTPPTADPGVQVRTGARHTCMRSAAGQVWCWGASDRGQSGVLMTRTTRTAIVFPIDESATDLAVGADFGCAATATAVYCWGDNARFQVSVMGPGPFPSAQATMLGPVGALALGGRFGVLRDRGQLRSWGDDSSLQLGDSIVDGTGYAARPVAIGTGTAGAFGVGDAHGCADMGTRVACWGANGAGQLATGAPGAPVGVPMPSRFMPDLVAIDGGDLSTCVLTRDHVVLCAGANGRGQLGDGTTTPRADPTMALPLPG